MKMKKPPCNPTNIITYISLSTTLIILLHIQSSPLYTYTPSSPTSLHKWKSLDQPTSCLTKLRASITFLPLKDLTLAQAPMDGTTWFMSSLNDTHIDNETEHLQFPSQNSNSRLLCLKGNSIRDGTKNLYALAYPESLPGSATLLKGLTFVSDTYYDYVNMWHGVSAIAPFVGWSMKNSCAKPSRFVLFHRGELRDGVGSWVRSVMEASFGDVPIERFESGDGDRVYCFERAVVMRHNMGKIGRERKHEVSGLIRCKCREFCGIGPGGRGVEVDGGGEPVIRVTLLMRRGARSFENETKVIEVFGKECGRVVGCVLEVVQSEELDFCDQVRVMTNTDIVASPHGAQLTNMLFMDAKSSVLEFFPRGWLEFAGIGQYAHHWMADLSGLKHRGAWWEPLGAKDCPNPRTDAECFHFYKQGKVGHNETYFAEWARKVLADVRKSKLEGMKHGVEPRTCAC